MGRGVLRGYWYQLPSPVDTVEGKKRLLQVVFRPPHTGHGMQQKVKKKKKRQEGPHIQKY